MADMVERVAKAIEAAGDLSKGGDIVMIECARAAIEAMRELTPPMWDAMNSCYQSPACMWMAAIDEALRTPSTLTVGK